MVGSDAMNSSTQLTGHFPDSQDSRNTIRARIRYQLISRVWLAAGAEYGSGLPFAFTGTYNQAVREYALQVANRIDFADGRIRPMLSLDVSAGLEFYKKGRAFPRPRRRCCRPE